MIKPSFSCFPKKNDYFRISKASILMKRYILILLLAASAVLCPARNLALLVGIGQYPAKSGWNSIHSENDIDLLKPLLIRQHYQVTTIKNAQATKSNILRHLTQLASTASAGDCVYIHFSCHGQQMEDLNLDEPDGRDEALIPYDAQKTYRKGIYEGENHLCDDVFNVFINKINRKIGTHGRLFVALDACHSGDGLRDEDDVDDPELLGFVRGTDDVFTSHGTKLPVKKIGRYIIQRLKIDKCAKVMSVAACSPGQHNYEYIEQKYGVRRFYGSLSYCMSIIIAQTGNPDKWYDFFKDGRYQGYHVFPGRQKPYIELF